MLEVRPDGRLAATDGFLAPAKQRDASRLRLKPHLDKENQENGNETGSSTAQSSRASGTATQADTNLARQGSNFGLPIALNLTMLMEGGIGIVEVLELCSLIPVSPAVSR